MTKTRKTPRRGHNWRSAHVDAARSMVDDIRAAMVASGKTRTQIANSSGLCTSTLRNMEKGGHRPLSSSLQMAARAVGYEFTIRRKQ